MIILEYINNKQMTGFSQIALYALLYVYCKHKFNLSDIEALINILLYIVILSAVQFVCLLFAAICIQQNEMMRSILGNILALFVCISVLPRCGLEGIIRKSFWKNKFVKIIFGFMMFVIIILLLQDLFFRGIYAEFFIFSIPALLMLMLMLIKWNNEQIKVESVKAELKFNKSMQNKFEDLLAKVRLQQHELKNHMAAVFSSHYAYSTYEQLVQAQTEYCKKIRQENKYNNLLLIGNNILSGFLYGKFQEIEDEGIIIEYYIKAKIDSLIIEEYYLIEILGVLLDNAVEDVKGIESFRNIYFAIKEAHCTYQFVIRNRHSYVPYEEIEKWFLIGNTSKGNNRGLGLYHVKMLCEEKQCNIACKNVWADGENWIEFTVEVGKTIKNNVPQR